MQCDFYKALIDIKIVLAWCVIYQDELMQNWELVKDGKEPEPVPPMRKG